VRRILDLASPVPSQRIPANWVDFFFVGPGQVVTPVIVAVKALVAGGAAALFLWALPVAVRAASGGRKPGGGGHGRSPRDRRSGRAVPGAPAQRLGVFAAAMGFDISDREA